MKLHLLDFELAVLRLAPDADIPAFVWESPFYSLTRTPDELSLFLAAEVIPAGIPATAGWRAFHVVGSLDLSMFGIISALTMPLAAKQISVFSISTHDTDYLIVPADRLEDAMDVLSRAGHQFV
ncbi:MAG: ACT domain-containing protein [Opitutales bacterium]